ncbi:MAG TPA: glycerate kinase [Phnomibacter sp.]|nr:glycerate kinase [Phnomibacter sp.]
MKILLAPDKFKGALTALEACAAMEAGIREVLPEAEILSFPMADGGDGFSEVMGHYLSCDAIACATTDSLGRPIRATYQLQVAQRTAIIGTASAAGLALIPVADRNAMQANTYGTGLMIADAIHRGATTILLGLGGSATTDMGTGILQALGFEFLDENGKKLAGSGEMLTRVRAIKKPDELPPIRFVLACDVTNPLFGHTGAAFVYAPQKGADEAMVKTLDEGLRHCNQLFSACSGRDPSQVPGSGAAGGIGAGLSHFYDVEFRSGFDMVLQASGLLRQCAGADLLLTGEGKFDAQSLEGKATGQLIELANEFDLNCAVFCGMMEIDDLPGKAMIFSINDAGITTDGNIKMAWEHLKGMVAKGFPEIMFHP